MVCHYLVVGESEFTTIQCFLDRCHKRRYIFGNMCRISMHAMLWESKIKRFKKVSRLSNHPLQRLMQQVKQAKYKLRNKSSKRPEINTSRLMITFINRLNFK